MATPTAAYSIRLRVRLANRPGTLGHLATAIGDAGGNITAIRTLGGHRRFRASEIRRCLEEMSHEDA